MSLSLSPSRRSLPSDSVGADEDAFGTPMVASTRPTAVDLLL